MDGTAGKFTSGQLDSNKGTLTFGSPSTPSDPDGQMSKDQIDREQQQKMLDTKQFAARGGQAARTEPHPNEDKMEVAPQSKAESVSFKNDLRHRSMTYTDKLGSSDADNSL